MLTTTLVSGNLLFEDCVLLPDTAKIRLRVVDTSEKPEKVILEENPVFDARLLSLFKYLPFEVKNFEMEKDRIYKLMVHIDVSGQDKISKGDFISTTDLEIKTGLEEFHIPLSKVE